MVFGRRGGFLMGREWSYMDEAFRRPGYNPSDQGDFTPNLVFVIMPFSPEMDGAFRAIQEACASIGLHAKRADDSPGSGIVLRDITDMIEQAEFLVVDLTHERPNVYYELGYAHGVGNASAEILLVARAGTALHFDVAPIRVRFYSSVEELRELATRQLSEMVRATRGR
jgi:hypothetical protein